MDDKIFDPFFKRFAEHNFMAASVFSMLPYIIAAKIVSILAMQTLLHLQAGSMKQNLLKPLGKKNKIKLKKFVNNFRMFYPYVTS